MHKQRPKGVTLIGVLDIIGGVFLCIGGIGLIQVMPIIAANPDQFSLDPSSLAFKVLTGTLGYAISAGLIAIGIADIAIGIGLLKGKQRAWKIAIVLTIISIAIDVIMIAVHTKPADMPGSVIGVIINLVILYYLYRPNVKEFFGKSVQPTSL